jgi:membrane-associated protein
MLPNISAFIGLIIKNFGYAGIGAIVFVESGLLLGFILPGDSLIFLAGILAARGYFNIVLLISVIFITGIAGDNVGYLIGKRLGRKVFEKKDSFIFNQKNLERTEQFFEKYGKSTFLMQRFLPVLRAFGPLLGGVAKMRYQDFFLFDLMGTALWSVGVTLLGFYLGQTIPNIDSYLLPIVAAIIIISFIPGFLTYRHQRSSR